MKKKKLIDTGGYDPHAGVLETPPVSFRFPFFRQCICIACIVVVCIHFLRGKPKDTGVVLRTPPVY